MPTIKDIAREAGVSHGTVSNVINGRGNVSVEKIRLVWQAAEKLGYKVNAKAQSLRLGKDRAIAVMLPGIEYTHWAAMDTAPILDFPEPHSATMSPTLLRSSWRLMASATASWAS